MTAMGFRGIQGQCAFGAWEVWDGALLPPHSDLGRGGVRLPGDTAPGPTLYFPLPPSLTAPQQGCAPPPTSACPNILASVRSHPQHLPCVFDPRAKTSTFTWQCLPWVG